MKHALLASAAALLFISASYGSSMITVGRSDDGTIVTPIGQRLAPAGRRIDFDGRPNSIALSPDRRILAVANIASLDLIDRVTLQRATYKYPLPKSEQSVGESPQGLTFSRDGSMIFVSTYRTALQRFDMRRRAWMAPIVFGHTNNANGSFASVGPLPAGIATAADGRYIYLALDERNEVVKVDLMSGVVVARARTGIAPMTIVRSGSTLAVLNMGGPFPHPTQVTRMGGDTAQQIAIDPATGLVVPGTVTFLSANDLTIRGQVTVGRHPAAALFTAPNTLLVADANDDALTFVDVPSAKVAARMHLTLPNDGGWGLEPQALALSADGRKLLVALAGANGIGVYRVNNPRSLSFIGALPTDWYPGAIAALPDGGIAVANLKGIGSLGQVSADAPAPGDDMPTCGLHSTGSPGTRAGHDAHMFRGSIDILSPGDIASAPRTTAKVVALANAFASPARGLPPIHHVFLIVRENRSYDQVLGDLPQGHGDPRLTDFPKWVTPNTHALAEGFVLLDNFYSAGTQSGDGHQWIVEAATTDYIERSFPEWARSYPKSGDDPLAYAASGFIWENALRHGLSVRDYGEFAMTQLEPKTATWTQFWQQRGAAAHSAAVHGAGLAAHDPRAIAHSEIPDLDPYVDRNFAGYNLIVPDQLRADEFIAELERYEQTGKLPNLTLMSLGDDHTAGLRPGFPNPCSMIADNDLALGRIVQAISHSKFWADSLIMVMEDDSQDGLDHIDGHRQVALMAGPWVKRGAVDSHLYSQLSFIHTAEALLGLPPMNRFDAAAPVMYDAFAPTPDQSAYQALSERLALDAMNKPAAQLRGDRRALAKAALSWRIVEQADSAPEGAMRRSIWLGAHAP